MEKRINWRTGWEKTYSHKKMKIKKGLFFDELDLFFLKKIFDSYKQKKDANTWNLSKEFVSTFHSKEDTPGFYGKYKSEIDNTYRDIKRKIKKYKEFEIIRIIKNGEADIFELDLDKVTFAKHKFSDGFRESIVIRI